MWKCLLFKVNSYWSKDSKINTLWVNICKITKAGNTANKLYCHVLISQNFRANWNHYRKIQFTIWLSLWLYQWKHCKLSLMKKVNYLITWILINTLATYIFAGKNKTLFKSQSKQTFCCCFPINHVCKKGTTTTPLAQSTVQPK